MNSQPLDTASAESLLAFWRDAGVDACFEDAPVDRTHVAPPPAVKAVAKATASVTPLIQAGDALAEARRLAAGADTLEALGQAIHQGRLWLHVRILDAVCAARDPVEIGRGWVPAKTAGGDLNAWFWSRGC